MRVDEHSHHMIWMRISSNKLIRNVLNWASLLSQLFDHIIATSEKAYLDQSALQLKQDQVVDNYPQKIIIKIKRIFSNLNIKRALASIIIISLSCFTLLYYLLEEYKQMEQDRQISIQQVIEESLRHSQRASQRTSVTDSAAERSFIVISDGEDEEEDNKFKYNIQPDDDKLIISQITYISRMSRIISNQQIKDSSQFELQKNNQPQKPKSQPIQIFSLVNKKNYPQQIVSSQLLTVMIIITGQSQIENLDLSVRSNGDSQQIIPYSHIYYYHSTNINIYLFTIYFSELNLLHATYTQKKRNLLVFTSRMKQSLNFGEMKVYGNVGLLFPLLGEEEQSEQSIEIINYSIIVAQQFLSKKIETILRIDRKLIKQFYYFFKKYFSPYAKSISQNYKKYEPNKTSIYSVQFFLYFFYMLYRQNAMNKLKQFNLFQKLTIQRRCSRVLNTKYYQLFNNSQCFQEYILHVYFLLALQSKDPEKIRNIVYYNLKLQRFVLAKNILETALENYPEIITLLNNQNINTQLKLNQQISMKEYLGYKIKACEWLVRRQKQIDQKIINDALLSLCSDLIEKIASLNTQQSDRYDEFRESIKGLYIKDTNLRVGIKDIPKLYTLVKLVHRCAPQVGDILIPVLKGPINRVFPTLARLFYQEIILAMILSPELEWQNTLLINYFQTAPLETASITFLIKFWLYVGCRFDNISTVQFLIIKFFSVNPSVQSIDLQAVDELFSTAFKSSPIKLRHSTQQMLHFRSKIFKIFKNSDLKEKAMSILKRSQTQ